MSTPRRFSILFQWFFVLLVFGVLTAVFFQALQRPTVYRMEKRCQLVHVDAVGPVEENGYTVYREIIPECAWTRPVCAVTARQTAFTVELDGQPVYSHTPGAFDHGSTVHWVPLPRENLAGKTLLVYSPSNSLTVLAGDHNDLILYYQDANAPALIFAFLFFIFGMGILLMSLTARLVLGRARPWTLRYLGIMVLLMGLWVASDTTVAQMFTGRIAGMNVLSNYSFMALPFFLVQFFRSIMDQDSKYLRFLARLHLADLSISGLLQALHVATLSKTLFMTHALMILTLASILWILLVRRNSEFRKEVWIMLIGFGLMGCCCALGFYDYYLLDRNWYVLWLSTGMLLFVTSLLAVAVCYVYREMIKSSRLQYYQKLANTDMMTTLQSRTAFEHRMGHSSMLEGSCACLMMDVNNLKEANDTMGHIAGDELISDAAECVLDIFEPLGDCYRMGGDEFVVLLEHISEADVLASLSSLELVINRKNLTRPFPLSLAIGYATGYCAPIELMLNEADQNMYQKKRQMKSRVAG